MLLVFGSINIDLVLRVASLPRPGETVLAPGYTTVPGGKGANQAVAAARDGAQVRMVGRVGRDPFAKLALDSLTGAGIDVTAVAIDQAPTGCAVIGVDSHGENQIMVASGANAHVAAEQVDDALLGPQTTVILQMEVAASANAALIRRARRRGARIMLNLAPAAALPEDALRAVDMLLVNVGEAEWLAAQIGVVAKDHAALTKALATALDVTVVATLGARGALAAGDGALWQVGAMPITPVDTTGAGDAFVGVLAASLDSGNALETALRRGSAAAGLACEALGAQSSLPFRAAIDQAIGRIGPTVRLQ